MRNVFEDSEGSLYFAPDRGNVFRSNHSLTEFGPIADESGSHGQVTTFTIEDRDGCIWFGTENGLTRYDKQNRFELYNNADGIPNLVFTLCKPVIDENGDLWMGNNSGLVHLDYERMKDKSGKDRVPIEVSSVFVSGRDVTNRLFEGTSGFSLGDDENEMILQVSNLEYIPSQYQLIEYCLEGVDEGWQTLHGNQEIHYYDLEAGDREFKLRYAGDPDTESSITVSKTAPVAWAPWIIGLLVAALAAGAVAFGMHLRKVNAQEAQRAEKEADAERNAYRTSRLSVEECKRLVKILGRIMAEDKPYKDPNLKSNDLARMAGTSGHALSFLFNQYLKKSYYDYVNEYRVEEFKRLVNTIDRDKYTLTAMSQMCGFSSRASFFRHFKAVTGITPAEYLKQN